VLHIAAEPTIVRPETFNDAQSVAAAFVPGVVVDLCLEGAAEDDAQRLKDFASGMVYATGGTMEKVGPQHFRLTNPSPPPPGPETSGDREPRSPHPLAGTDAAALPLPTPY